MDLQVAVKNGQGKWVLALSGRFDFHSHRQFRDACEAGLKAEKAKEIDVDFGGVDYMDSSALGMLLLLREKASAVDKKIALVGCRGTVLQILEVANFHKLFAIQS